MTGLVMSHAVTSPAEMVGLVNIIDYSQNDEVAGCLDGKVVHAAPVKTATAELMRKYFCFGNLLQHLICLAEILCGRDFMWCRSEEIYSRQLSVLLFFTLILWRVLIWTPQIVYNSERLAN